MEALIALAIIIALLVSLTAIGALLLPIKVSTKFPLKLLPPKPNKKFFLQQTWTYEMKSIETHSENPDLVSFHDFKVERIGRGVYAASGMSGKRIMGI